jgi:quercetin dioxygenase-like cupin family protein
MSDVRRVVLGVGPDGRSCVTSDAPTPTVHTFPGLEGYATVEVWSSDAMPPPIGGDDPTTAHTALDTDLPPGATRFLVIEFPPGGVVPAFMHATDTVDYIVVLDGWITLELEEGEVRLGPGDTVIQRAERHAWRADGPEPCRLAVVMLSTKEA